MEVVVRNTDDCPAALMSKLGVIEHLIMNTNQGQSEDIEYNYKHEAFVLSVLISPEFVKDTITIDDEEVKYSMTFKVRIEGQIYILPPTAIFPSKNFCNQTILSSHQKESSKNNCRSIW